MHQILLFLLSLAHVVGIHALQQQPALAWLTETKVRVPTLSITRTVKLRVYRGFRVSDSMFLLPVGLAVIVLK